MPAPPRCSVVIPHLRGTRPLLACLHALFDSDPGLQVVLVDNASTDGSVEAARRAFPGVEVVRAPRNLGYAGACNLGLEEVRAPWCIFLNDDAVVAPGTLAALIGRLETDPDAGGLILQPALRSSSEPGRFDYAGGAGGLIDRWGYPFALGRLFDELEEDSGQYLREGPLAWASGCCMAGAADCFVELGGFEEAFFAHFEEIDLCWRHRRMGGRVRSLPQAVVYHMGPSTLPEGAAKTRLNFRNSIWTLRRNLGAGRRAGALAARLVLDAAAALRWLLTGRPGQAWSVLRGWAEGIFRRPWRRVEPGEGIRGPRPREGVYAGSAAAARWLRGVRAASELLPRTGGWEEGSGASAVPAPPAGRGGS
ncbi:MAG: glycosyltransferase family 2 protein [bacterium]